LLTPERERDADANANADGEKEPLMNRRAWFSLLCCAGLAGAAGAVAMSGCGSDTSDATGGDGGGDGDNTSTSGFIPNDSGGTSSSSSSGAPNNCTAPTALTLAPADKVVSLAPGAAFTQAYTVTASYAGQPDQDVTAQSFLSIDDPGAGSFTGSTFTWSGTQGGVLTVSAKNCGVVGTTHLTLKIAATFGAGGLDAGTGGGGADAGLTGQFNGAPATGTTACNPTLVYPPEGVLVPPNMNVVEVHFTMGSPANNLFEVSFENAVTDVKVYTSCTSTTTPGDGQLSSSLTPPVAGGCIFELNQAEWDYIAKTNRDGDPVVVKVRGLGCDGSGGVGTSNTRSMSFAKDDMRGTLYYWASVRLDANGNAGTGFNSGGVFRYDFGVRGQTAQPVLTPASSVNSAEHNCIGCHDVSRDGRQMVFDFDDNDSDDEYGDVYTNIYDIAASTVVKPILKKGTNNFPPGFHTWNRSTTEFLLSDGPGDSNPADAGIPDGGAFARVTPEGGVNGYTRPGTLRATTPDWAPDDSRVVFAVPPNVFVSSPTAGYWMKKQGPRDDLMFAGASLWASPWNAATKKLDAPVQLLASDGTNNFYYPSFSPDGSLIVYNYAPDGSNFHNPKARVEVINASAATPTRDDLAKLNDTGDLTNSWARWAPFVQTYKGKKLLWVTTSSTRDYGLRIQKSAGDVNCYPNESPNFVVPVFTKVTNCTRTQLWMAAVDLDPTAVQAGTDVSHPAFYLPFQDSTTNNHLAQWAQKTFQGTCTANTDCSTQPGKCCESGGCTTCPTPPAATCTVDANCANGTCCNAGTCGPCAAGADAGSTSGGSTGCSTCLDCNNQACVNGACGSCTNSSQCCAPLVCVGGSCVSQVN
jgi:hypothetical protein